MSAIRRALLPLLTAAAWGLTAGAAQAAAPVFTGTLQEGVNLGTVQAESGPFGNAAQWSFWQFTLDFGLTASITVTPQDATFDPIIAVFYGIESDTANYFDLLSSSLNTTFVAGADGLSEFGPRGAGAPAGLRFDNLYGSGPFVLAIADYTDGAGSGALPYSVALTVPEPETYAQMALGLGLLAAALRARRRT